MPVREMAKPIPVLTGSEYRDMKTMKKHVKQKTTGMKSGTCGQVTLIKNCNMANMLAKQSSWLTTWIGANPDWKGCFSKHFGPVFYGRESTKSLYLKGTREVRLGIAKVDQTQDHDADEEPTQEAHEVQQAVDVSDKQLKQGHRVLLSQATHTQKHSKQEKQLK